MMLLRYCRHPLLYAALTSPLLVHFQVIYIYSIMGCIFFGVNDPARFGTVPMSVLTLFQVSTIGGWSDIAYTNWYGCEDFIAGPYNENEPRSVQTTMGGFLGLRCDTNVPKPGVTFFFFTTFIVLTSWVIMSLFIGVISMGMVRSTQQHRSLQM